MTTSTAANGEKRYVMKPIDVDVDRDTLPAAEGNYTAEIVDAAGTLNDERNKARCNFEVRIIAVLDENPTAEQEQSISATVRIFTSWPALSDDPAARAAQNMEANRSNETMRKLRDALDLKEQWGELFPAQISDPEASAAEGGFATLIDAVRGQQVPINVRHYMSAKRGAMQMAAEFGVTRAKPQPIPEEEEAPPTPAKKTAKLPKKATARK